MSRHRLRPLAAILLVALGRGFAAAQTGGATASLSGIVVDQSNAVLPGVTVAVTSNATGVSLAPAVTNQVGLFSVAALDPATYSVTFSLAGFKTVVMNDVRLVTATPTDLKITLEVGTLSETVTVPARTEVVQRQSTTVSATLYSDQIRTLPLNTRNSVNFLTLLPGVDTGSNHIPQFSTIAGLPQSMILMSIDGIQTHNPSNKSADGFYSYISPSVEAIEEVTVSTATPGADASGQGATQIKFTTRSGTSRYAGTFFETLRHPVLNASPFFNKVNGLPLNRIVLNQFGGNVGGPILLPGFDLRRKAFFFTNYEELRQASELTRTRTMMSPAAMSGLFSYSAGSVARQVNVLALAAANGQVATSDATVANLLAELAAAASTTGSTTLNTDANTSAYTWNSPDELFRRHSTTRVDVVFGPRHRLSAIYNFNKYSRSPDTLTMRDPRLPGLPNYASNLAFRNSVSATLRSMLGPNLVNEATSGSFWATNNGGRELSPSRFANQGGYSLTLAGGNSAFAALTPATAGGMTDANGIGNHWASNPTLFWTMADKVSWQRGRHAVQLGGELTFAKNQRRDQQLVPALSFGVAPNDPADALFTTTNFPGASNANLADARFLYALLTGRVASVTTELGLDPVTNQYVKSGKTDRRSHQQEIGLFVQDAFRVAPNLTLNAGLRYELQLPLLTDNSVYSANTIADACGLSGAGRGPGGRPCNFFTPGTATGVTPVYQQYRAGTTRYQTDWNNLAPSIGVAWLPDVKTGPLRALLGDPDQATIRVAYGRAFSREGLNRFGAPYEVNPGPSFDAVRNVSIGNLVLPGETWPLLLRESGRLGPGAFPPSPIYPLPINRTAGVNLFDPNWEVGVADSFSAGIQRAIFRDTAIEVRYVGTRGKSLAEVEDWNEVNLLENGFLNEFRLAQANLYANDAAGRGQTIAYAGPGTGTSPLPTYLAYFTGSRNASDPAAYTGTRWNNTAVLGRFARLNPNPVASAGDLYLDAALRANALAAGIPANFFVLNPDVGAVNVHVSKGSTRYDALQVELRRRMSQGLATTASYSYAKAWTSRLDSIRVDRALVPSLNAVPHSLKLTANFDVPVGRGRRFGATVPWIEWIAGGWSLNATGRITSGSVLNFGNVRLVGMTLKELQQSIRYRIVPAAVNANGTPTPARVYNLPQDIIDNTVKAFSLNAAGYTAGTPTGRYLAPANGPDCIQMIRGDCAPKDVIVVAPLFSRFDLAARKRIGLGPTVNLILEADVLNLFNAINFNPVGLPANSTNPDAYRVTTSYQDVNQTSDPGSRVGQLVFRLNW